MTKEERNEYCRVWRAKRKAAGICVQCGLPAVKGRARCSGCLEAERKRAKMVYRQKAIDKYKEVQDA